MRSDERAARLEQALLKAHRNRPPVAPGPDFTRDVMVTVRQMAARQHESEMVYTFFERLFMPMAWASGVVTVTLGFYAVEALKAVQAGAMQAAASQTATLLTLQAMGF
ncbi:MAG: hypothetical protein AB7E47_07930 [Desulfovibrionaceae bacterium]